MKFKVTGFANHARPSYEISEDRYNSIKSAKNTCLFALELEEKYALLLDNYSEFQIELLKLAEFF
jgi:hypothetical protein